MFINQKALHGIPNHRFPFAIPVLVCVVTLMIAKNIGAAEREVAVRPGDDVQALVQKSPENTTFRFKPGVYRQQSIRPKDGDSFIGEPGAVLSGAMLVSDFTRQGRYWVAKVHAERSEGHGQCQEDAPGCVLPEDVFFDDHPLRHEPSADAATAGKWHMDYDGDALYLADDPTGHKVEISLTRNAFQSAASNVTIHGLVVEKYANPAQRGAIHVAAGPNSPGENWKIEDCEVRWNHGVGIRFGNASKVLHNNVHDNGQLGIAGSGKDALVEGNEIAHNNYAGYKPNWEAGGSKFTFTEGLVVRNNFVHDNNGPGLWTDIDNVNTIFEDNRTARNKSAGIATEISFGAIIRNNTVDDDGVNTNHPNDRPWYGAGILVIASSKVEVYGNHVTNCMNGIVAVQGNRGASKRLGTPYEVRDLYVHDNVITQKDGFAAALTADRTFGDAPFRDWNNRFVHNTYHLANPGGKYFEWGGNRRNPGEWRGSGQDREGSW